MDSRLEALEPVGSVIDDWKLDFCSLGCACFGRGAAQRVWGVVPAASWTDMLSFRCTMSGLRMCVYPQFLCGAGYL